MADEGGHEGGVMATSRFLLGGVASDRFAGADADKSGDLTRAEFATTAPKPAAKPKCRC